MYGHKQVGEDEMCVLSVFAIIRVAFALTAGIYNSKDTCWQHIPLDHQLTWFDAFHQLWQSRFISKV
jgi:hypothetical protein